MCISFITVSTAEVHASVASKSLEAYIRDTLLVERDMLQSRVVKKEIQLRHLDALCELLDELASPDPFEKVNIFFKEHLQAGEERALEAAWPKMDLNILVPCLFKFIKSRVRTAQETTAPIGGDYGWLAYAETDGGETLSDLPWFDEFPDHIGMPCIISVYHFLHSRA